MVVGSSFTILSPSFTLETITRKRGFSAAPGAIAGMVSAIGYLGDRRLWTRENAADASIDVPRIGAIVSIPGARLHPASHAVLFTDRVLANDSLILAS
jgi:hypothetical protein